MKKKSSTAKKAKQNLKEKLLALMSYEEFSLKSKGQFSVNTLKCYFNDTKPVSGAMELIIVKMASHEIKKAEKRKAALLQRAMAA